MVAYTRWIWIHHAHALVVVPSPPEVYGTILSLLLPNLFDAKLSQTKYIYLGTYATLNTIFRKHY